MARIRTIKPEFWSDEKLAPLDPMTRLVFLGLLSHADDAGRLIDSVRQLDGMLFPYSDETCEEALETLARLSRIVRYTSRSGQSLIQVTKWADHQRVDKPSKYVLPAPPSQVVTGAKDAGYSRDPRETLATPSQNPIAPTMDLGANTPDQDSGDKSPSSAATAVMSVLDFLERTGSEWRLKDKSVPEWVREIESDPKYRGADTAHEVRKAADWHVGNKIRPKRADMALRKWLEKAATDAIQKKRTGRGLDRPLDRLAAS